MRNVSKEILVMWYIDHTGIWNKWSVAFFLLFFFPIASTDYGEAEDSYTKALQICPACFQKDRAVLFSNRAAAKMKQVNILFSLWNGKYWLYATWNDEVIKDL